ncbi:MAG: hypothetical protein H6704_20360 [Myxococcales bacterium]|nr:hypothetical protein [Myxococcales bacterium]MCB9538600.1 hypothetical protein [Myxococcales bacterium]
MRTPVNVLPEQTAEFERLTMMKPSLGRLAHQDTDQLRAEARTLGVPAAHRMDRAALVEAITRRL